MRNLHDLTAQQSAEHDYWRALLRETETNLAPWQRRVAGVFNTNATAGTVPAPYFQIIPDRGWHADPLTQHRWREGTPQDAYVILGELEIAADRLRMNDLDRRPHIALYLTREEWYTLRTGLDWATLNTIFPEGTVPQFRGIPLMLR